MTDAHCHTWDILEYLKNAEELRRETGTACAANSWNREQFEYNESLAKKARQDGAPPLFCCFALHPQLSAAFLKDTALAGEVPDRNGKGFSLSSGLELLQSLGAGGRLDAVGETGFDLYDAHYRAAEKIQDEMFICHLETALRYGLPLILHVRRAMHKIFPYTRELKKLPALIFHSWSGTRGEAEALLRRGINAYFSFGNTVLLNHKTAMECAAVFPADRLLLETDAPYQPLRGKSFSSWPDLVPVCRGIAALRKAMDSPGGEAEDLQTRITENFFRVFV